MECKTMSLVKVIDLRVIHQLRWLNLTNSQSTIRYYMIPFSWSVQQISPVLPIIDKISKFIKDSQGTSLKTRNLIFWILALHICIPLNFLLETSFLILDFYFKGVSQFLAENEFEILGENPPLRTPSLDSEGPTKHIL